MADEESSIQSFAPESPRVGVARRTARPSRWAINVIAVGVILAICYFAEKALAVMLVSLLIAFILVPVTEFLTRFRLPRGVAAALAVGLMVALLAGLVYLFYNQASTFLSELPKYSRDIREELGQFRRQTARLEELNPDSQSKNAVVVRPDTSLTGLLARSYGSLSDFFIAASFIPFLVYFMLTWHQHARSATVMLFPLENRHGAYVTLGQISQMIRGFLIGNLLVGLFMAGVSTLVFGVMGLPFFYFIGFISGYLSLIPYLGVLLALAPPLFFGIGHLHSADVITIVATVFGLHLLALNVLYPKFLGNRVQLNPLAVTLSLLAWAWLWGAVGLVLAVPITAAMKIIFDHVETLKPYGAWLGE